MIPVLYGYCQNLILNCQSKEILPNENFHCQKTLKKISDLTYLAVLMPVGNSTENDKITK